jgi:hypothetical protein
MKTNNFKKLHLLSEGISNDTLKVFSDNQIDALYRRFVKEAVYNVNDPKKVPKDLAPDDIVNIEEDEMEGEPNEELKKAKKKYDKKMKTPIATLGMFEEDEEKIRQIEESIVSLIRKNKGTMYTKEDILNEQPSIAPAKPVTKPGIGKPSTPYKPKHSPKPKAGTEIAPARPTTKPGISKPGTPYKPKHSPKPKAGENSDLPTLLTAKNLFSKINFKDE